MPKFLEGNIHDKLSQHDFDKTRLGQWIFSSKLTLLFHFGTTNISISSQAERRPFLQQKWRRSYVFSLAGKHKIIVVGEME